MDLSVEEFLSRLEESGLTTAAEAASWFAEIPEDQRPANGEEFARRLVEERRLTSFQAQSLAGAQEHPLVLGQYVLLEQVGQGGTGTVYRALHQHMKREVALKVLHAEHTESTDALRRFQREMLAGGRLSHPHIIPTLDAAQHGDTLYLVMDYVPGEDLAKSVQVAGPREIPQVIRDVLQVASGLAYAHQQGIIHRDIKPANLLRDRQGNVRILDLGLARFLTAEGQSELTGTGDLLGTVDYMAPEQALHTGESDERSDIYSLGCTLFFLLTGRPPYSGESLMSRLLAHRDAPVPSVRPFRPEVPPALDAIVQRMLAKQPDARFQSMSEVITALKPFRTWRGRRPAWLTLSLLTTATVLLVAGAWYVRERWGDLAANKTLTAASPGNRPPAAAVAPFEAEQAARHQEAWARYLGVPGEIQNSVGMRLRLIPPGKFLQGASPDQVSQANASSPRPFPNDGPQHEVVLTQPYYVAVHEVTQQQYAAVMGTNPAAFARGGHSAAAVAGQDTSQLPVETVSWFDAIAFCNALSVRENRRTWYEQNGEDVVVTGGDGYRLPTEAEWEFACRAGTTTMWSVSDDLSAVEAAGWFAENSGFRPQPVGLLRPNPFGLYDMHGNLWEWCEDLFDPKRYQDFAGQTLTDPRASTVQTDVRCMRGGVWNDSYWLARSAHRGANGAAVRNESIGLRLVLNVPQPAAGAAVRPK